MVVVEPELNITFTQQSLLNDFRLLLADEVLPDTSDNDLLRWLEARNFEVNEALKMYREHLKFRTLNKIDTFLDNYEMPEVLLKYYPGGICGHDKNNNVVYYLLPGLFDAKGFLKATTPNELHQYAIYEAEMLLRKVKESSEEKNMYIGKWVIVVDAAHFGFKHLTKAGVNWWKKNIALFEANYPERLENIYIINSPKFFRALTTMLKPFVAKETFEKVSFLKSPHELLRYIPEDNLPVCYGGSLKDHLGDGNCEAYIKRGGIIPTTLYKNKLIEEGPNSEWMDISLRHSQCYVIWIEIEDVPNSIKWEFYSDNNSINFGLIYKPHENDNEKKWLLTMAPAGAKNRHVSDYLQCAEKGFYGLYFENTSKFKQKSIKCIFEIL